MGASQSSEKVDENASTRPKKRKLCENFESDEEEFPPVTKKKLHTTSEYIYKTLFLQGENSDVTIYALGREWQLHKVYLCQSLYFRSMFKGDWSEKNESVIRLIFPDDLITVEALDIAFGSMYRYEVDTRVLISNLIPVIAASRMFHLEGLLKHCEDSMLETVCAEQVCLFYEVALRYGLTHIHTVCFAWLERNLLLCDTLTLARHLTKDLIKKLLVSHDLVVMQVEMDIYNFLKIWLYLRLTSGSATATSLENSSLKKLVAETQKYFEKRYKENISAFLATEEGLQYADVFRYLRLENMLGDLKCIGLLERDAIIPQKWLLPIYRNQWKTMLSVYNGDDTGPKTINEEVFYRQACRCGRILETDSRYCWRWTGLFSFGVDLILFYNNRTRTLLVKRNTYSQPCNFAVCLQSHRSVVLRLKAFTLTANREEDQCADTGLLQWDFHTDEELPLLTIDESFKFPVYVSTRFLLSSYETSATDA